MFCSKCGKELVENVLFCSYCGNKIEQTTKMVVPTSNTASKPNIEDLKEYFSYAKKLEVDKYTLNSTVEKIRKKKSGLGHKRTIVRKHFDGGFNYFLWAEASLVVTIIALIVFGIISSNVDGEYFGLLSVGTHFCITLIGTVLGVAIIVIIKKKKIEDEYSALVSKDKKRVEEEKGQISVLANQEKQLLEKLNKVDELLANLYSLDVIYPKYRELIPVVTMLEYLESGRCDELTGANGAYNIYESEVRQNIIISSLGRVISMLGSIRDNQYALYQVLQHSNSLVEGMSSEIEKLAESNYAIAKNSKTAAYYSQIAADSTKISAYIDSCNFRGIKYI